jgi:tRNA-specific 2-thiouridylase
LKSKGSVRGGGDHAPWFVARKDVATNTLYAVQGHDHPWLLSTTVGVDDLSWIAGAMPAEGRRAAKTRYRQGDAACVLRTGAQAPARIELGFDAPQWAATPGQSAVVYAGEVCLGGGVIVDSR